MAARVSCVRTLRAGAQRADNGLIFTTTIGTPLDAQNIVNRHFKLLLRPLLWNESDQELGEAT